MRNEENLFLASLESQAAPFMKNGVTFECLKDLFKQQKINLEMDRSCFAWVMSESLLGRIEETLPKLIKIAEKPRSFIESHNEKVLVESAKRISHKAIAELSADSKDWYSRTYVSVKPKRINAEVSDETLNIYENRVFVSLIKRIEREMYIKRCDSEEMLQKAISSSSLKEIEDYLGLTVDSSAWSFPFYKSISFAKNVEDNSTEEIDKLVKRIDKIDKLINRIKQSNVYKDLRKLRKEHSPILNTNIFLYDKYYRAALELWKDLDREKYSIQKDISEEIVDEKQAISNYELFAFLCMLYSFIDLKYEPDVTSGLIYHYEGNTFIKGNLILRKRDNVFTISGNTKNGFITILYENKTLGIKCKTYHIHFDYSDLESNEDVFYFYNKTEKMLSTYTSKSKKDEVNHIVCISFDGSSKLGTLLNEKLSKRILSFGDSFSSRETDENIAKWGNYKNGFLNLVPQRNLANNLLKIERFISYISISEMYA